MARLGYWSIGRFSDISGRSLRFYAMCDVTCQWPVPNRHILVCFVAGRATLRCACRIAELEQIIPGSPRACTSTSGRPRTLLSQQYHRYDCSSTQVRPTLCQRPNREIWAVIMQHHGPQGHE